MALLATKPQSGYDIARQMRPPLGHLWQANHGQIYTELASLVKARLVDFEKQSPSSGPPRKVHALTAAGRAELNKWVAETPSDRASNDEFVVKASLLRTIPQPDAIELINQQIATHESRLGALETRQAAQKRFGEQAALRRAIGSEREYLAWCRWLLAELGGKGRPRKATSPAREVASRR